MNRNQDFSFFQQQQQQQQQQAPQNLHIQVQFSNQNNSANSADTNASTITNPFPTPVHETFTADQFSQFQSRHHMTFEDHQRQRQQQQQQQAAAAFHYNNNNANAQSMMSPPDTRHNSSNYLGDQQYLHFQQQSMHQQASTAQQQAPILLNPIILPANGPNDPPKIFTESDLKVLREILPPAETHKWKYISNKVSKAKAKKMNSEFCSARFHDFFQLPYGKSEENSNVQYLNNKNSFYDTSSNDNCEGIIGSSLPYMVHPDSFQ